MGAQPRPSPAPQQPCGPPCERQMEGHGAPGTGKRAGLRLGAAPDPAGPGSARLRARRRARRTSIRAAGARAAPPRPSLPASSPRESWGGAGSVAMPVPTGLTVSPVGRTGAIALAAGPPAPSARSQPGQPRPQPWPPKDWSGPRPAESPLRVPRWAWRRDVRRAPLSRSSERRACAVAAGRPAPGWHHAGQAPVDVDGTAKAGCYVPGAPRGKPPGRTSPWDERRRWRSDCDGAQKSVSKIPNIHFSFQNQLRGCNCFSCPYLFIALTALEA